MNLFTVTYDAVTPESAEHGDVAAAGFALTGGWLIDTHNGEEIGHADVTLDLRSALSITGERLTWVGGWFDADDADHDYLTGTDVRFYLHPPRNITPSSLARLRRLLNA